jgi:pimeloyl-ACP methyl ester carboxylesterase
VFRTSKLITVIVAAATITAMTAAPAAGSSGGCRHASVAVSLAPGLPVDQRISGTFCRPAGKAPRTVQLLVPGGYYGQAYWLMRGNPTKPSYVETMTRAGYATFAIDRLGAGRSSHPMSTAFRPDTHTDSVRQVIAALRDGRVSGRPFDRVVLVGHSLSSAIATKIAVDYPAEVDGVVLSGFATKTDDAAFAQIDKYIHPANRDRRFAHLGLDAGYTTTRPGTRIEFMYYRQMMSKAVLALDELTTTPEVLPDFTAFPTTDQYARITVPVLAIVGQHDDLICGGATGSDCSSSAAFLAQERPWYGPKAELEAVIVKDNGHSLNLQLTGPAFYAAVRVWTDRKFGR